MTNISKILREKLAERTRITCLNLVKRQESATGEAVKFLFELPTGHRVESVLIVDGTRRTVCLSSQVGCPLDCKFCATGRMGMIANLEAGQIVDQLLQVNQFARERGEKVTNVVMMGMGEPLLNYSSVVRALKLMRLKEGIGLGGRKITVSTAGYIPGIRRLMAEDLNVGLAISLNATTDEMREQLMPINRKYKIADLLAVAREFFARRGYGVTFEYVLMAGLTDSGRGCAAVGRTDVRHSLQDQPHTLQRNNRPPLPPTCSPASSAVLPSPQRLQRRVYRAPQPRAGHRRSLWPALSSAKEVSLGP